MENKNNEQEKENEVKEAALKYGYISPKEYLRKERDALYKSEYFNGYVEAKNQFITITTNYLLYGNYC